jgi:hypothetical protein
MKKSLLFLLLISFISFGKVTNAQKYFTYDGKVFNILFSCNDANTKVESVQFSSKGKWVDFELVGKTDLEGTKAGGFIFHCKDGKGDYYAIDYYRKGDYVIVHACDAELNYKTTQWKLERRNETEKEEVKYFTYDGATFNILFSCDAENTKVLSVEFSSNDKWVPFTLVGKTDLEGTKDGGFLFHCKDGKGKNFAIDYYREGDYVIVHACDADLNYSGTQWRLEKRKE